MEWKHCNHVGPAANIYMGILNKRIAFGLLIGAGLAIAGSVFAVNVTIPQSTAFGDIPRGNTNGTYTPVATSTLGLLASTSISATAPLNWNSSTGGLTITQSGVGTNGYLSSTDWNLFNNKISSTSLSATSPLTFNPTTGVFACATCLTTNQTITLSGAVTGSGATAITTAFGAAAANSVLANITAASAIPSFIATSSLFSFPWSIANGGTNATGFSPNVLIGFNGSAFIATGTPQLTVGNLNATSTEGNATTTINHAVIVKGGIATSTSGANNRAFRGWQTDIFATSSPSGAATTTIVFTGAEDSECVYSALTLTCPSNTAYFTAELWGSGGGGGGSNGYGGSGGGGGGYVQKLYSIVGPKYFYNLGFGGNAGNAGAPTSPGTTGVQSQFGNGTATTTAGPGIFGGGNGNDAGAGGQGSGGDINMNGQGGQSGNNQNDVPGSSFESGGIGGMAPRGGGGGLGREGAGLVGEPFGGGGSGGGYLSGVGKAGGAGGPGGLVLTIYTY